MAPLFLSCFAELAVHLGSAAGGELSAWYFMSTCSAVSSTGTGTACILTAAVVLTGLQADLPGLIL